MRMRFHPALTALLMAVCTTQAAENLIENGDFESGALTPWTGVATVTNSACVITNGTVTQSVVTQPGVRYYFSADVAINIIGAGTCKLQANDTQSMTLLKERSVQTLLPFPNRVGLFFVATGDSTDLTLFFQGLPAPGGASTASFDNVTLYEAPETTLAGRYTGTLAVEGIVDDPMVKTKATRRIAARITPDNRITILDGVLPLFGVLLNDGTLDINYNISPIQSTAKIRGKRITIKLTEISPERTDIVGESISSGSNVTITLTRVGR